MGEVIDWNSFLVEPIRFSNRINMIERIKEYEIKMAEKLITHSIQFSLEHGGLFMYDGTLYLGYINPMRKYIDQIIHCRKRMYFQRCTKKLIDELKEHIRMYYLWREEHLHPIVDYARYDSIPVSLHSIIL